MTQQAGVYPTAEEVAQEDLARRMLEDVQGSTGTPDATPKSAPTAETPAPPKAKTWEENLKDVGLTPQQGLEILEGMLEKGFYEKSFPLYGGRKPLVLRTRDGYSRQRVANTLDNLRTNDPRVISQTTMRLLLAGSIVRFGTTVLAHAPGTADAEEHEKAFAARLAFIDGLADPFIDVLYGLLARFDAWTFAALSNGAPAGF